MKRATFYAHADSSSRVLKTYYCNSSGKSKIHDRGKLKQEIWAYETRDSIILISYAGCLGLCPVISANIYSSRVRHSLLKSRKIQ